VERVLILVDGEVDRHGEPVAPPAELNRMVAALKQAIATFPYSGSSPDGLRVETLQAKTLSDGLLSNADKICPLTLDLPLNLPSFASFSGQQVYRACQNILGLRQQVEQQLGCLTGSGSFWLPVVLTAKGALYAEVIWAEEPRAEESEAEPGAKAPLRPAFYQPLHLSDRWRQPLYWLGERLLRSLSAPPATYLIQFDFREEAVCFDRLLPFPAAPAIASIGVQSPDLFACHWLCLTKQPILDLTIPSDAVYRTLPSEK
jgi:hypothetical protein